MSSRSQGDAGRAEEVARLSDRVAALAEALEVTERAVGAVRRELSGLGLEARFAPLLDRLAVPSSAAEELMDELDRYSGELADDPPASSPPDEREGGLADDRAASPVQERLAVRCQACGRHFERPAAVAASGGDADLDGATYRCPHCGEERRYETWDHFVEG